MRNGAFLTLDQGIPAHELAEQANGAVQEPPPKKSATKKKKGAKSNGVVEPRGPDQVNGDAMDVEPNGGTHPANSVRAESEAVASEAESPSVAEIPISTLSIGQSAHVQTEVIADLAPSTTFIPGLKDPEKIVQHTSWGPRDAPLLLTAGKSLLNIHSIAKAADEATAAPTTTFSLKMPTTHYSITALCWISNTDIIVSAREEIVNETGEKMMIDKLINITDGGEEYQVLSSTAGLVTTLKWNQGKELLLSISTDGERGSIKIWNKTNESIPVWAEFTDTAIFDALWISDSAFVVCGIELFRVYEIGDSLSLQRTFDTKITWDNLQYEPSSGIVAALGVESRSSNMLGIVHPNEAHNLQVHQYPDQFLMHLDFRSGTNSPLFNGSSLGEASPPLILLSTCSMSGFVRIWNANAPFQCLKKLSTTDESQAFKVSFSPDGTLLAAAGPDAVTVWDLGKQEVPIASWRAREMSSDKWDPMVDGEFNLGWDPDSSRLSVALGNQVSP